MKKLFFLAIFFVACAVNTYSLEKNTKIEVLYFHATTRCSGCITIEEFTKNTLNSDFEKQLKDSSIVMKSLDFLQSENEHFMEKYEIESQTLIISKIVDGKEVKWKNLDKIWEVSDSFEKYEKYIKKEINKFLK